MSIQELHNILVSGKKYGGIKEEKDSENNIIISDSTLLSLLPPQFKEFHQDRKSCVVMSIVYFTKV